MPPWAALVLLLSVSSLCLQSLALCHGDIGQPRKLLSLPSVTSGATLEQILVHQDGCKPGSVTGPPGVAATGWLHSKSAIRTHRKPREKPGRHQYGYIGPNVLQRSNISQLNVTERRSYPGGLCSRSTERSFKLDSFFGSVSCAFTDAEYDHRMALNEKYDKMTDETDDSGLPLAPENEDYEVEEVMPEGDGDLSRPPSSKEEWYLKRLARGRRFWHKYFADPSQQSLRFYRLVKMKHDMRFCNRVVRREYRELRPEIKPEVVDGKEKPLTRRQRNLNRSRIQTIRTTVGYDNTSEDSNILILLTLPQARLVRMVERIRLPHLLALRNFEMLRLLQRSMLYMAKPNIFESTIDFLLTFSRLNTGYQGQIPMFCELPVKPEKRLRPMIYAVIGKPKEDPFKNDLLKVRSSTPPPIREEFPRAVQNETSVVSKFLDACQSLTIERLRNAQYDLDAVLDRDFSDNFAEMMPSYTTKESFNRIDYPATVSYSREMRQYLTEEVPAPGKEQIATDGSFGSEEPKEETCGEGSDTVESTTDVAKEKERLADPKERLLIPRGSSQPWNSDDVKRMLKYVHKLGLTKPSTLMKRIKSLHCDIGFSFEDILWIGRMHPQVLRFGNYRQHCQQIYDCDEELTFSDVLAMVHEYPCLMTYNVMRCLQPKLYYMRRVMKKDIKDIVTFPKVLTYSLYDRIIPRHLAIMNGVYKGEFLKVYRYLFESGFYKGYGQTITDPKVPDILPSDHSRYLEVYASVSGKIDLRQMLTLNDDDFICHYDLSYRDLAQGKEEAIRIPLPTDLL